MSEKKDLGVFREILGPRTKYTCERHVDPLTCLLQSGKNFLEAV
jgi:hypothetical protein